MSLLKIITDQNTHLLWSQDEPKFLPLEQVHLRRWLFGHFFLLVVLIFSLELFVLWLFIGTFLSEQECIVYFYNWLFIVTSSMLMFERHLRKTSAKTSELASTPININIVWKWQFAHKGCWSNLDYRDKTRDIRLRHPRIVPVAVSGVSYDICLEILI